MHGTISRPPAAPEKWSENVVDRLAKLANDGASATVIANTLSEEFGETFSRNAVMGKIHRLRQAAAGEDPRAEFIRTLDGQGLSRREIMVKVGCGFQLVAGILGKLPEAVANARRVKGYYAKAGKAPPPKPRSADPAPAWAGPAAEPKTLGFVEFSARLTIMELKTSSCRWPVGEPTSPDLRYCGARHVEGHPYCASHCRAAFQPMAARAVKADLPTARAVPPMRRFA
jgi:GcrA cell cycle regulator